MKNKFYFLFFFLFFLIPVIYACSPTGPCQGGGFWCVCGYPESQNYNSSNCVISIDSISNISVYKGEELTLYMNDLFLGYSTIEAYVNMIYNDSEALALGINGSDILDCTYDNQYCLYRAYSGTVPYIFIKIKNLGYTEIDQLQLDATNISCGASPEYNFPVYLYGYDRPMSSNITTSYDDTGNFFIHYSRTFRALFPASSTLTTSDKLSVVIISLFIITIILYVLMYLLSKKLHSFHHWIVFIIDILMVFFFIGLGYIPIVILVVVVLILLALTFFRIKSGQTSR